MEERFGGDAGSALFGKTIRVTGKVTVHRGEPQIVVRSPDQIVIVDG